MTKQRPALSNIQTICLLNMNPWLTNAQWNELHHPARPWSDAEIQCFNEHEQNALMDGWGADDAESLAELRIYEDRASGVVGNYPDSVPARLSSIPTISHL